MRLFKQSHDKTIIPLRDIAALKVALECLGYKDFLEIKFQNQKISDLQFQHILTVLKSDFHGKQLIFDFSQFCLNKNRQDLIIEFAEQSDKEIKLKIDSFYSSYRENSSLRLVTHVVGESVYRELSLYLHNDNRIIVRELITQFIKAHKKKEEATFTHPKMGNRGNWRRDSSPDSELELESIFSDDDEPLTPTGSCL